VAGRSGVEDGKFVRGSNGVPTSSFSFVHFVPNRIRELSGWSCVGLANSAWVSILHAATVYESSSSKP
jgi:hypothetical protein